MKVAAAITLLAAIASVSAEPPVWNPDRYPIGFWCGPPDKFVTPERFKQIADAGFTVTFPACSGASANPESNRKILDAAQSAGLKVFVQDHRMPLIIGGNTKAREALDAIVAAYSSHPAMAGYFVADEPAEGAFDGLGEVAAYLRMKDPAHVSFINLLPNFGVGAGYEHHVEAFATTVKPFTISYDHYHFHKSGDGPGFFPNLETIRKISLKHGVPFWNIVLAIQHGDFRSTTEAEKRFEAMQTLAYGGKGLLWFTYWQPEAKGWGDAIINFEGTPTRQYDEIKRINADVQTIGKHLLNARSTDVIGPGAARFVTGVPATLGLFAAGAEQFALVATRDYKNAVDVEYLVGTGGRPVQRLDKSIGKWVPADATPAANGDTKIRVRLASGDGELFRW
jgi:hypothetical protein